VHPHPHQPGLIYSHDRMYARKQPLLLCVLCGVDIYFTARVNPCTRLHVMLLNYSYIYCPKTKERKFNLGVLNLYEKHFIDLFNVKYAYSV
jgi:hypothetical protein